MYILEINSLKKSYENFQLEIDLKMKTNEFVALIGPNGTGKTTTLKAVLNMVKKDSGGINIFGMDHIRHEVEIKEKMGIILEQQYFYKNIKVNSIIKFYSKFYPHWNWNKVMELKEKFHLIENKKFKELSKGMKVKLAFIIALSTGASFFVFDEPTSGLDPATRHDLLLEINELKKNKNVSILFTSHIMSDVEYFAERIIFINNGKIIVDETKDILKNEWKKISLKSEKNLNLSQIEEKLYHKKKEGNMYTLITKKDPVQIKNILQTQVNSTIKIEDIDLNEMFIEIVNKESGQIYKEG
jgi:ABC-2 type transport system ATP-binding protein